MSRVSERVLDASPADDREVRSTAPGRSRVRRAVPREWPARGLTSAGVPCVAPSLAMSTDAAAERGSQPAQRDELAHSHTVPICGGVSPPTNVTPPTVTTRVFGSLHQKVQPGRVEGGREHAAVPDWQRR